MAAANKKNIKSKDEKIQDLTPIKVQGSQFFPEMRMICSLLALQGRPMDVVDCNIFSVDGQKMYKAANLALSMPLITINTQNIMADPASLAKFLCMKYQMAGLYPLNNSDEQVRRRSIVDSIMDVVYL